MRNVIRGALRAVLPLTIAQNVRLDTLYHRIIIDAFCVAVMNRANSVWTLLNLPVKVVLKDIT